MISTEDFIRLFIWSGAQNKKPGIKKIGKYAMLSRIDGINNYLMYSDTATQWDNPCFQEPRFPWEFTY
jgi:hypothetical protein